MSRAMLLHLASVVAFSFAARKHVATIDQIGLKDTKMYARVRILTSSPSEEI